jgi:cellulose biosynthesis protein BcsQ
MKSVAMFNNKGGVGKTTLLCNLGAYLALHAGVRVLLVDCDAQCNTTQLVMGEEFASAFYWDDHHEPTTTIADLLQPIQDGDSQISEHFSPISRDRNRFGCDIIAGHPTFSFLEDKMSAAWSEVAAGQIGGYRKTNWARALCQRLEDDYDIVLFDVGPSLGAINRSVLLGCDYFVTPMGSDIFSILGVRNIQRWLNDAIGTYEHGVKRCDEVTPGALDKYFVPRVPSIRTGFIGYTLNQYLTKSKGGERIATDRYEEILRKVPQEIERIKSQFGAKNVGNDRLKLGDVPHMYSLIPLAQTRAAPIGELASRDGIVGSHYKMIENYEHRIEEIATNFIQNTGLEVGSD